MFNAVPGPDEPSWQPSEVIGSLATGDQADITAYVTGICGAGFIVTDATGSIFVYMGSSFDSSSYAIGDQVTISGTIGAYNRGLQVTGSSADIEITGKGTYEYPAPVAYTGAALDAALARTDNEGAIYGTMTGTVKVSGNNINILVEGAETAQGGIYYATDEQKALLTDGSKVTVNGYFIAIAGSRYCNFVATEISPAAAAAALSSRAAAVQIASSEVNAMYRYSGGRWTAATEFAVPRPRRLSDHGPALRQSVERHPPRSSSRKFCDINFPYALEGDASSMWSTTTTLRRPQRAAATT